MSGLTEDDWKELNGMRKLRNNVHINTMDTKLYYHETHNREQVEKSEELLKKVADEIMAVISQLSI